MYGIFSNSENDCIKFHVFTSDKELLRHLTRILEKRGFISAWEKSGEMRFLLDGRRDNYQLVRQIETVTNRMKEFAEYKSGNKESLRVQIARHLIEMGFRPELKGTEYILEVLVYLLQPDSDRSNLSKGAFQHLARQFKTEIKSIDRSIRYAKHQVKNYEPNGAFLFRLFTELRKKLLLEEETNESSEPLQKEPGLCRGLESAGNEALRKASGKQVPLLAEPIEKNGYDIKREKPSRRRSEDDPDDCAVPALPVR